MSVATLDEKMSGLAHEIVDLSARQAASEAVLASLIAIVFSNRDDAPAAFEMLRTKLVVHAKSGDNVDAQVIKLRIEHYIQDLIDRIEKVLRG